MAESTSTSTNGAKTSTPARRAAAVRAASTRKSATTRAAARRTTARSPVSATPRRNVAERAALVSVGATLEARDRAVALVADVRDATTTREGAERRISKLERRGTSARARLERGVGKARARVGQIASSIKDRVAAIA